MFDSATAIKRPRAAVDPTGMGLAALSFEATLLVGAVGVGLGLLAVCIMLGHADHQVRLHRLANDVARIRRQHRSRLLQDRAGSVLGGTMVRPGRSIAG
ncbi:MAG: hypothetical protein KDA22_08930 [Phycisphaerales bacterium]|nr:hypothetical protein [Phycisphaerales bacterium]